MHNPEEEIGPALLRAKMMDIALFLPLPLIIIAPRMAAVVGIYLLILFAVQIVLLALRGQTIGLGRAGLRITSLETGNKPPFLAVFLRYGFGMVRLLNMLGIRPGWLSQTQIVPVEPQ
jgi:uncharacterized RDD family membrane protein YckC